MVGRNQVYIISIDYLDNLLFSASFLKLGELSTDALNRSYPHS